MADDLIHCPSCGFQLRLPTELYGTAVECPQCHARFTAPAPTARPAAVRPPPGREYDANARVVSEYDEGYGQVPNRAASAVKAPAIILLAFSAFTMLGCLYGAIMAGATAVKMREMANDPNFAPWKDALLRGADIVTPGFELWLNAAAAGVCFITVLGAIQMLRLRTYWLAVFGTILGLIPINCCCIIELPIAIWALVVLFRADVRAAFR